jgi:hypothetical protein
MKPLTTKKLRQRGSSLIEFIFVAPIILVTGGATLDVARFAQTQQITSFISQETASLIYRECLDKTVYSPASANITSPWIDKTKTQAAIQTCIQQIQVGQQDMLTLGAPGAAVIPAGFRIVGTTPAKSTCAPGGDGTLVSAIATPPPAGLSSGSLVGQPVPGAGGFTDSAYLTWQSQRAQAVWRDHPMLLVSKIEPTSQQAPNNVTIPRRGGSVVVNVCQRELAVVVEVTYAFEPFVKFLPNFITGWQMNQDGEMRETTAF